MPTLNVSVLFRYATLKKCVTSRYFATGTMNFAVIGAGIVGLSTAVRLQDVVPQARVTIISDKFNNDTTSSLAAGMFGPTKERSHEEPLEKLTRWTEVGAKYLKDLYASPDSFEAGLGLISTYELYNHVPSEPPFYAPYVYGTRPISKDELRMFARSNIKGGFLSTTIICEGAFYLPYMLKKFRSRGGLVVERHVESFDELTGYDLVFNCSALGARELCNDMAVHPVRGQVFRVDAPHLKHGYYAPGSTYVFPGRYTTVVGGVRQKDNWSLQPTAEDRSHIWEKCVALVPTLKNAKIVREVVGLRPHRTGGIRLEFESRKSGQATVNIVHNYGHGANGIGLSWGTVVDAVDIGMENLRRAKL